MKYETVLRWGIGTSIFGFIITTTLYILTPFPQALVYYAVMIFFAYAVYKFVRELEE